MRNEIKNEKDDHKDIKFKISSTFSGQPAWWQKVILEI